MKLQSTDKQNLPSEATLQVGNLNEIQFAKVAHKLVKIRDISRDEFSTGIAEIFVKASNLLGIKDPITNINKQDIKEMLLNHFNGLSLEEIDYAFKMERYGFLGEKTQHFQLMNADYVSQVLKKYKKWLQDKRIKHNISITQDQHETEVTPEEQERLIISGVSNAYEIYKQTKKIEPGYLWVYYHLHELSLLPDHTKEFKQVIQKRAVERFESRKGLVNDYQKAKEMVQNKGDKIAVICKEIILEDYFASLVKENINILEKL